MKFSYKASLHNPQQQQHQLNDLVDNDNNNNNPFQYKITSVSYSPTGDFLAVSTIDKISIYDECGSIIDTIRADF